MIKFSNDIYIYFALEKEIGKIAVLKKHAETLRSILKNWLCQIFNISFIFKGYLM